MNAPHPKRMDEYHLVLPRRGEMKVDAHIFVTDQIPVEPEALDQLADAASLPGVDRVLATPDIHVGFGVPIGAVVASSEFVSPAAVGYDINCGMRLINTPWKAHEVDVESMALAVRGMIPLGEGKSNIRLSYKQLDRVLAEGVSGLLSILKKSEPELPDARLYDSLDIEEENEVIDFLERQGSLPGDPQVVPQRAKERGLPQLGTLGGGNHFIEFQRVDRIDDPEAADAWGLFEGQLVLMIHSGSRGLGHEVGGHYMKLARKYDAEKRIQVPSGSLAILPLDSRPGQEYLGAMKAAANYAFANREMMAILIKAVIRRLHGPVALPTVYDVAHNLASFERHGTKNLIVHRKGATRAFPGKLMTSTPFSELGQPVLIPGSMGTASYLLRGIEQGDRSLYSTNHGAGRTLSRSAALGMSRRKRGKSAALRAGAISDDQFRKSMQGILLLCENRRTIKEEAPAAYKDIDMVIQAVIGARLAAPVARVVPLAVLKG